ncbi:type III-B CRISPR module RAMP protein Cmr4 [Sulfolobus sp. E5-1-F]|uniref:type III-B CRISPR module RAMP protein Cmr4 n=1 Tax=Saccharolobus sp. E5-1-F TaxID=2663019 RepID=UPI00129561C2|nr:type III-B CRISPR module RAMP protein Cmr4 [Sulfolobus sp. E5-1-F]QGA53948.1 type III-B CRISPR module RAMP protein Cmr4 [Sulfolobus sp. E5-1-F]
MLLEVTYKYATPVYIKVLTPLHPGVGQTLGSVDLPVQRDTLGYPIIYSSSIKGAIRSAYRKMKSGGNSNNLERKIFGGSEETVEETNQSKFSVLDAYLLTIPTRALNNVYVYLTSDFLIQRLNMYLEIYNILMRKSNYVKPDFSKAEVLASENIGNEFLAESYQIGKNQQDDEILKIKKLLQLEKPLVALKNDLIAKALIDRSLMRIARVKLNDNKTVEAGPWTEEYIPPYSYFITLFLYKDEETMKEIEQLLSLNQSTESKSQKSSTSYQYIFIGGKETTGKGLVKISRFGV